ncbi:hypothetical protein DKT69_10370 [Micromonospora sicca]|uniref:Uncharacterized protein n=1 Tax=Micromonospora sicca TaxID=2202420 RepID=A0A317DLF9_9ACTN|nr:hypothetical protein DKT69_10370 [Micromonospora sp. 4G51]
MRLSDARHRDLAALTTPDRLLTRNDGQSETVLCLLHSYPFPLDVIGQQRVVQFGVADLHSAAGAVDEDVEDGA